MPELITNPLALSILVVMKKYCALPRPILETQCRVKNIKVNGLTAADIPKLAPALGESIANFTNPEKGKKAEIEILHLG